VEIGTTNGLLTEITSCIDEGTDVLVDFTLEGDDASAQEEKTQNPFMPRPRNNNKNQQKK
jgi:HlyD family secretion protein